MGFMDCEIVFVVGLCIGLLACCLVGWLLWWFGG